MDIIKTIEQNVAVLSISGRLMGQPETHILFEYVYQVLDEGQKLIVIDLEKVNWINSLGIGSLMKCLSWTNEQKGHLFLSGLNKKIKGIFDKTQLSKIFIIENRVGDAVKNLHKLNV
ncbi:MAG: anti-sigma factor antagonist [Calditrichaeota bacterium]|nr:MAG: anti-sigma factor antagonist [Calditrichota bacterium]MBL1205538.1 anti-sigma factor antagonist [Calditrichota bacterium]NOG45367.1 STAS domain-containing protein [Calditrichota bacterium]